MAVAAGRTGLVSPAQCAVRSAKAHAAARVEAVDGGTVSKALSTQFRFLPSPLSRGERQPSSAGNGLHQDSCSSTDAVWHQPSDSNPGAISGVC